MSDVEASVVVDSSALTSSSSFLGLPLRVWSAIAHLSMRGRTILPREQLEKPDLRAEISQKCGRVGTRLKEFLHMLLRPTRRFHGRNLPQGLVTGVEDQSVP